jgi:serine/threonine-protein kinase RsbW
MSQYTENQVKITKQNNPEGIVERMVVGLCEKMNIKEERFGNILLAITEAVDNAIEHGNKNHPDKAVELSYKTSPEGVTFTVADQGQGFDPNHVADPTHPENISDEGRGLFVMKHLADKVAFEENGKKVVLSFNLN